MAEDGDISATGSQQDAHGNAAAEPRADVRTGATGRRAVLTLGAIAASSVVTIRPALAQTASSVLTCRIPIPDPPRAGKWIGPRGELVPPNTQGAVPPPSRPITGEEARRMIGGSTPPGIDPRAREAYVQYIRRLRQGTSGFTCFASVQMLRP